MSRGASLGHGLGLGPFRALDHLKLDLVAFIQGTKPRAGNRRVMDEDVRTILLRDEPKPFVRVKPLHRALRHDRILLAWGVKEGRHARSEEHKNTATGLIAAAVP
jgi:hypothetical protein